mgnify:CR=1 FL=1
MTHAVPALRAVDLDDKYQLTSGRVFLTGAQALVRLLMLQRQRDSLAGLNTAGFVSGYRGSPLGGVDQSLWKAAKFLERGRPIPMGVSQKLSCLGILAKLVEHRLQYANPLVLPR